MFVFDELFEVDGFAPDFRIVTDETDLRNGIVVSPVDKRFSSAFFREFDLRMLHEVILKVHDRVLASDEEDPVSVVEHSDLVWRHEISGLELAVLGKAPVSSFVLAVGVRIDRFFA